PVLIDTRTEKYLPPSLADGSWHNLPGGGMVAAVTEHGGVKLRRLPAADRLDLPADPLQLWAQVAVRGELSPDGQFVKWDEPTWERKRQQLAAVPASHPDL